MQMKSPTTFIEQFCTAAAQQADATERGEYKRGNNAYARIMNILKPIEAQQATQLLKPLLQHPNAGVRVWAASYLLSHNASEAETTLNEIAKQKGIQSLNAQTTLEEWQAGKLQTLV